MGLPPQRVDAWRYPPKPTWRDHITEFVWVIGSTAFAISIVVLAIG